MTFILGSPGALNTVDDATVAGVTDTWTGWDGSQWLLSSRTSPVHLRPGVVGRHTPPFERQKLVSTGAGARWLGRRTAEREVFWPLTVAHAPGQGWLDLDRAFWSTMHPDRPGVWTVTQPSGATRSLVCRFVESSEGYIASPGLFGWAQYGVDLVAEQPYWTSPTVWGSWGVDQVGVNFFGGAASFGPPFVISASQSASGALVGNAGDEPAWGTWWVENGHATIGVGDAQIVTPTVASGRMLVVDSSPAAMTAIEVAAPPAGLSPEQRAPLVSAALATGTDRTIELGTATRFASIPAGGYVDLAINLVGGAGARVTLAFTPQHWRAW